MISKCISCFGGEQLYGSGKKEMRHGPVNGKHWGLKTHTIVGENGREALMLADKDRAAANNFL